eukprot:scaffold83945_cov67-Phaeocystis_antarctica.AAC.3
MTRGEGLMQRDRTGHASHGQGRKVVQGLSSANQVDVAKSPSNHVDATGPSAVTGSTREG